MSRFVPAVALCLVVVYYVFLPYPEDASHRSFGNNMYPPVKEGRKPINLNNMTMSGSEVKKVLFYLKRDVGTYLEWGSGGTTYNFAQYVSKRFVAIENDAKKCSLVRAKMAKVPYVQVRCVPSSAKTHGEGSYLEYRKYIDEIDNLDQDSWDFVFLDGHARVDAAIKVLSYIRNNSVVVLHDSWRMRWKYAEIYDYYDVVDETLSFWSQGAVILKRKSRFARFERNPLAVQRVLNSKYNL